MQQTEGKTAGTSYREKVKSDVENRRKDRSAKEREGSDATN